MSLDLSTVLRVLETCDELQDDQSLISFVFPKSGGGSGQVFLEWKQGRSLRDYLRDPVLEGKLSLYQATHSRIVDHKGVKRRLTHVPQPGDELRFIKVTPSGGM